MTDRSILRPRDALRVSLVGLRTRTTRAVLSALGITIGIASMVAVLGLSESSKSDLISTLDRLGTNLIVVEAAEGIGFGSAVLPESAAVMVDRINPVETVSAVGNVDAGVYRSDLVPTGRSGGIAVHPVDDDLLATLNGTLEAGAFLDQAASDYPVVVLGSTAAARLGIDSLDTPVLVWLGDQWFGVVGILDPLELAPELDRSALIGTDAAATYLGYDGVPASLYVRAAPRYIDAVLSVIPATVNPENPDQVQAAKPTDALEARAAAEGAFTALFLGLGLVALVVGGVGVANVMVISVLERRGEIGLRRALGATRRQVAAQFVGEALILASAGGLAGVALGSLVTAGYAASRGWNARVPGIAVVGGIVASLVIGVIAGVYPARRAASMSPTEALRSA